MADGCYGLRWRGIPGAARYFVDVGPDAPELTVHRRVATGEHPAQEIFTDGYARVRLSDRRGWAEIDLASRSVVLSIADDYDDEALLHPFLAGSAATVNHWLGRDSFHAGAVVLGGRAWVIVGDKGDGKSTLLSYLATEGHEILADDLIVEDGGQALAGPGFIDLRPDAAAELGVGRDIGWLGTRHRSRFDLSARPARATIAGWLSLAWGDAVELRPVPPPRRIRLLYEHRTVRHVPPDPANYLRHAARPFHQLVRPKDWSQLPRVRDLLLSLGEYPSPGGGQVLRPSSDCAR